jgi:thymidine phosphorylase
MAEAALSSGKAAQKLQEIIRAQGGDGGVIEQPELLPRASTAVRIRSDASGYIHGIAADRVGWLAVRIGAGRMKKGDKIDHAVGIDLHRKTGDEVERGDVLADLLLRDGKDAHALSEELKACFEICGDAPLPKPLFLGIVDSKDVAE